MRAKEKHGMFGSAEYRAWTNMRTRCLYPSHNSYHNYGGRGITVCDEWRNSFVRFFADIGPKPTPKHQLDRIDTNGPYAPWNCRWVTREENNLNTRRTVKRGRRVGCRAVADSLGLSLRTYFRRRAEQALQGTTEVPCV